MSKRQGNGRSPREQFSLRSLDMLQTFFFMQTIQVGVGLFNLPRVVTEEAGHSGWQGIVITGVIVQLALWVIVVLLRRFQTLDLYGIFNRLLGKWAGNAIGLCFAFYCVAVAGIVARSYVEVVQSWLFPTTSTTVFFLLFLLPCLYCATGGPRLLGRFALMTFFATGWMMLLLVIPALDIQLDYYRPLFDAPPADLLRAAFKVSAAVVGFELLLVIYPFIQKKEKVMVASSLGIWFTTLVYLTVTLVAVGFYSEGFLLRLVSPTLHMFKIVQLPMIERMEQIGIATWSFLIVNTSGSYLWAAGRFLHQRVKWKERTCILAFVPFVFAIGVFPPDAFVLARFEEALGYIGLFAGIVLPMLLLLIALLFKKKGASQESQQPPLEKESNAS